MKKKFSSLNPIIFFFNPLTNLEKHKTHRCQKCHITFIVNSALKHNIMNYKELTTLCMTTNKTQYSFTFQLLNKYLTIV